MSNQNNAGLKKKAGFKKAQFYILAAAILCTFAYTALNRLTIPTYQDDEGFSDDVNNFITEAPFVINYAVYHGHNISQTFANFEDDFRDYLKESSTEFGIVYILNDNNRIVIKNNYNSTITITEPNTVYELSYEEAKYGSKPAWVKLTVDGTLYSYDLPETEVVDIKFLFKTY